MYIEELQKKHRERERQREMIVRDDEFGRE